MYFGEAITKIDDKGRITVPRKIRETMETLGHAIWYMARGYDHCIFLFHRDEFNKIRQFVGRHSSMDADTVDFRRMFFSSVAEVRPDNQGRIPLAPHLRDYAGLDSEAVLIGVDDHLELWSTARWKEFQERNREGYKEQASPIFSYRDETSQPERVA
ncbi:MAG: transcriptional regulator MraZ [Candidatus Hydrogenedentota bacterium]